VQRSRGFIDEILCSHDVEVRVKKPQNQQQKLLIFSAEVSCSTQSANLWNEKERELTIHKGIIDEALNKTLN
jgi:hypothetical protein